MNTEDTREDLGFDISKLPESERAAIEEMYDESEGAEATSEAEPASAPEPVGASESLTKADPEPTPETDSTPDALAAVITILTEKQAAFEEAMQEYTDLANQLDDGDIGQGKYEAESYRLKAKLEGLDRDIQALQKQHDSVEHDVDQRAEAKRAEFVQAATAFLSQPENQMFQQGTPEWAALDAQIIHLQTNHPNMPSVEVMQRARQAAVALLGISEGKPAETKPTETKPTETKPKRADTNINIPPTLGNMPAAESNSGGEFSHLDNLTGVALERAVSKLSPEQQSRYLNG